MRREDLFDNNSDIRKLDPISTASSEMRLPGGQPAARRPRVLIVGPGSAQIGGVTTFIRILMSSDIVAEKYDLIHLDTSRAAQDLASAGRFSLRNLTYLLNQLFQLVLIALRKHPMVMHLAVTSGWSFWKGSAFIIIGKAFRMKSVAHLHGGGFRDYYWKRPRLVQQLIGWVLRRADVVIALSGKWQRFLLDEVCSDLRVMVLPNTVDSLFSAAAMQDGDATRQSGKVVLFVGQLSRSKGVFDILRVVPRVLESHQDTVFLFAGGAHEAQIQEEMELYITQAKLGNAVQLLGKVTGQAKLDLFRRAILFALPSYGEGLPYVLLEAMAVGLPVITTPVGAIPELIEDGIHGYLIQPGDYDALARRIIRLLEDQPLRQVMGLTNRQLIRDHYLPECAMTQLVALYDRLHGISGTEPLPPCDGGGNDGSGFSRSTILAGENLQEKDEHMEGSRVKNL